MAACNSRFSGQRHVVSGALLWQNRVTKHLLAADWPAVSALADDRDMLAAGVAGAFSAALAGTAMISKNLTNN
jgi:hypothetical protein